MSHVVGVKTEITNLEDLKAAAEALGLEFREGQKTHKWYGRFVGDYRSENAANNNLGIDPKEFGKCDHALAVKGDAQAYEVGVVRNKDGNYNLLYDFWGPGKRLQDKIGDGAKYLINEYGASIAMRTAQQHGHIVRRENLQDGKIKVNVQYRR